MELGKWDNGDSYEVIYRIFKSFQLFEVQNV